MLRKQPFDLVLLDIMMPEMDGYEVLTPMKADSRLRDIPVIVISALEEMDSIVKGMELGAEDYLPKTFDPVLLRARIGACLEKKRFRDQEVEYLRRSSRWVWAAPAPVSKLWLSFTVGERRLACAQQLVHQVVRMLAPGCVPLFVTAGLVDYELALLTHLGHWVQLQHRQGRRLKLRWMPLPTLNYAQVIKKRRRRLISGSLEQIKAQLAGHGWHLR